MTDDFIEVYEHALDPGVCGELIKHFEASDKVVRGSTSSGVNTQLKDSWDICISVYPEWKNAENLLNSVMMRGLQAYVRKYPHLVLAPTALYRKQSSGAMNIIGADDIRALRDEELQRLITQVFRPGRINLQRYFADQGGYPYWHSEIAPKAGDTDPLHRVLLWSVYLNEGFSEGETEFLHQQRKIAPKTGALLIAPAGFTHTHRGNRPLGGNKYIATSWILFQEAERLYANPAG